MKVPSQATSYPSLPEATCSLVLRTCLRFSYLPEVEMSYFHQIGKVLLVEVMMICESSKILPGKAHIKIRENKTRMQPIVNGGIFDVEIVF